ncbi:hypothetical protein NXH76_17325 [Blautia schinkii]|nr:hypothetical protein [Blautia schinkii]
MYKSLSNDQLKQFPYPNLVAEVIESNYSINTLSENMRLGGRQVNDTEVWMKLRGEREIYVSEAYGLIRLFHTQWDYLFDSKLRTLHGKTVAYWRWYNRDESIREMDSDLLEIDNIVNALKSNPHVFEFIRHVITLNKEQREKAISMLQEDSYEE